ncbi:hypothetical protein AKJ16_DCAP13559 [Drosera capensis]
MVLWELTVATAYFLGLKRTFRLALKIQRRVISPRRPKIRQFLQSSKSSDLSRFKMNISDASTLPASSSVTWNETDCPIHLFYGVVDANAMDIQLGFGAEYESKENPSEWRTRAVFDVAAKVHQNIQQRDIEVGRNLGNWILRWLDRMKPSANIRGNISFERPSPRIHANSNMNKSTSDTQRKTFHGTNDKSLDQGSDRLRFSTSTTIWPNRSFPTIAMMLRRAKPVGAMSQFRQLQIGGPEVVRPSYRRQGFDRVIRKDIWDWMHRC